MINLADAHFSVADLSLAGRSGGAPTGRALQAVPVAANVTPENTAPKHNASGAKDATEELLDECAREQELLHRGDHLEPSWLWSSDSPGA
jgi:hypothetical protein